MGKMTELHNKGITLRWMIYIAIASILLYPINLAAGEPAAPNLAVQPQQEQNNSQNERAISKEDEKLWIKQIEIYGQIAKPQTVFIIPGTDPRVDGLRIDRHFFSHIFRPVEKSTLKRIQVKQGKDKEHILW